MTREQVRRRAGRPHAAQPGPQEGPRCHTLQGWPLSDQPASCRLGPLPSTLTLLSTELKARRSVPLERCPGFAVGCRAQTLFPRALQPNNKQLLCGPWVPLPFL